MNAVKNIPIMKLVVEKADHHNVKTATGERTLAQFISGMMGREPVWIRALYGVRFWVAKILGLRQETERPKEQYTPEEVPMKPGETLRFFTVVETEPDKYWLAVISDNHLDAHFGVVATQDEPGTTKFHVLTTVKYRNWKGPVYFNLIRPFHHLVVSRMIRSGIK